MIIFIHNLAITVSLAWPSNFYTIIMSCLCIPVYPNMALMNIIDGHNLFLTPELATGNFLPDCLT